jgi:hypothetical protein
MTETRHCPRCGRPLEQGGSEPRLPSPPEELCSYCYTGHGPQWVGAEEPDWKKFKPRMFRGIARRIWRMMYPDG